MPLDLAVFRLRADNAGVLLHDPVSGQCASVDVPDADGVLAEAAARGWKVSHVFVTHEHADHIEGIAALKAASGAIVLGPQAAATGAPVDRVVGEGDHVSFGAARFEIWASPGHSAGHVVWVAREERLALVGDVLAVMGCGRLFGGTPDQMWAGLSRLADLPDDTVLVTGHDYTRANARFARHVDADNAALRRRAEEAERRAEAGDLWAVTRLDAERATNPFLRAGQPALARAAGMEGAEPAAIFARLRAMKDAYRG